MSLSLLEATSIVARGDAKPYLDKFIGSVKHAAVTGTSTALSLDDALIVSIALAGLMDTAEGRKLLKLPKRKNTQYKASDYRLNSPQRQVIIEFLQGGTAHRDALYKFGKTFADPPDDRTLRRLFDDLVTRQKNFHQQCGEILVAAGAEGNDAEIRKAVVEKIMKAIGDVKGGAK